MAFAVPVICFFGKKGGNGGRTLAFSPAANYLHAMEEWGKSGL